MDQHIINHEINNDFVLSQLRLHIAEMEKNTKIFDRLTKKFISFQQEYFKL
jgi:hypothetical protein